MTKNASKFYKHMQIVICNAGSAATVGGIEIKTIDAYNYRHAVDDNCTLRDWFMGITRGHCLRIYR